jgi:protein O-GlcNAc transferase
MPKTPTARPEAQNSAAMALQAKLNQGMLLHQQGRLAEAERIYGEVLRQYPKHFDALHLLGVIAFQTKRTERAVELITKAIGLDAKFAYAHSNLGNALIHLKRHEDAIASYDKAIALKPDYAEAYNNRGNALRDLKRPKDALASYDKAIALKPQAESYYNRGNALQDLNRQDEALASYDRALALKSNFAEAQFAQCMAELPILYENEPEILLRRAAYERRLRALCDAGDRSTNFADLAKGVGSWQPFYLAYQGYNDRDLQALYGSFVCRAMAKCYPPAALAPPPSETEPVRVGIVSGFFRQHSALRVTAKGWLSQLDRRQFSLFGYYTGNQEDAETKTAAAFCDRFVQGPLPLDRWRQEILADAPHVLIYPEVGMEPVAASLAAQRLAPVQCNSWGHPETSGFPTIDYFLSSDLMEPPDGQDHYTERLVRLPNLSTYLEPLDTSPISLSRSDLGLRRTATVYWCGQSLFKYLPQFDQVFPRIAREAGDCQFAFIQSKNGSHITELFWKRLTRAFAAFGLRAADHCVMWPPAGLQRYVAAIGQCDIVLDSIGWSGGNTTLDAMTHDLPVVTFTGALMRGRHTMAILKMMGVTETIAETIDDYVSIAIRLARDAPGRLAVKSKIAASKDRIYFDRACISGLEQFLNHVVRGNAPIGQEKTHAPQQLNGPEAERPPAVSPKTNQVFLFSEAM